MSPARINGRIPDSESSNQHFSTTLIHLGSHPDPSTSAVIPPISLSTTFAQSTPGLSLHPNPQSHFFEYSRSLNPTRLAFETLLEGMELKQEERSRVEEGELPKALAFGSGSACVAAIVGSLVQSGGHVICGGDVYGGTFRYFTKVANSLQNVTTTFINTSLGSLNLSTSTTEQETPLTIAEEESKLLKNFEAAFRPNTRLVWLETPSNPLLLISSIPLLSRIAHEKGAILVADNTFMSPYTSNPISLGADLVVHSVTKYINGHSDVVMGAIIGKDRSIIEKLRFWQNAAGSIPGVMECWLALRGAKTLELRLRRHSTSALRIAQWLKSYALENKHYITEVIYPGLSNLSSPRTTRLQEIAWESLSDRAREVEESEGRSLNNGQGFAYGGMISIRVNSWDSEDSERFRSGGQKLSFGGDSGFERNAIKVLENLKVFTLAESLGGVESLVEHPTKMTHASVSEEQRRHLGIDDGLIRLSVGIEDERDLIADLKRSFELVFEGGISNDKFKKAAANGF